MRSRILAAFVAVALFAISAIVPAQEPKPDNHLGHSRGYVKSPLTKQLKAIKSAKHGAMLTRLADVPLPAAYETPYQIPQQNQGNCGSCWDVSANVAISSAFVAAGAARGDGSFVTSADCVMWCYNTGGCGGDDASTVMRIAQADGLPICADVGDYQDTGSGPCNKTAKRYKIDDWGFADANNDNTASYSEIKTVVFKYGVCVITVDANGLINGEQVSMAGGRGTDHQIVVVGWDDAKGSNGALLCKNQWGQWGFQHNGQYGYCWLGAFSDGSIAASGSSEVLWCQVNSTPVTPDMPIGLTVAGVTDTTVSLTWTAPSAGGATGYDVYTGGVKTATIATTGVTVTGLAAGTTYLFTVDAISAAGTSQQTASVAATTSGGVPPLPPVPPTPPTPPGPAPRFHLFGRPHWR